MATITRDRARKLPVTREPPPGSFPTSYRQIITTARELPKHSLACRPAEAMVAPASARARSIGWPRSVLVVWNFDLLQKRSRCTLRSPV
jgi:hypothetical protein